MDKHGGRQLAVDELSKVSLAVVLLSGGLDSSTSLAYVRKQMIAERTAWHMKALTFNYGQRHDREISAARYIADHYRVEHDVIDLPFPEMRGVSALVGRSADVPVNRTDEEISQGIPLSYVPMRNTVLLSMAAAHLETMALFHQGSKLEVTRARIVIGANHLDYSGYPDCRPEYLRHMQGTLRAGSKVCQDGLVSCLEVQAPLLQLTKTEIVHEAVSLGVPIERTWSCYQGGVKPCGECDSCILRNAAIEQVVETEG